MQTKQPCHSAIKWLGTAAGLTAAAYGAYAGITWLSYGHAKLLKRKGADPLLDVFMPNYDVVERHNIGVDAPPEATLSAATEMNRQALRHSRDFQRTRTSVEEQT